MSSQLKNLALSESGFLFNPSTGHTFSLNSTGAYILRQLIQGEAAAALAAKVAEQFDIDDETAARDCEQFLMQLTEMGLWQAEPEITEAKA